MTENWKEGRRQPAGEMYDLSKAAVFTEIIVKRVIIDEDAKIAKGIEMIDGRVFSATKEVIICCGSIKNPQLLGLSGMHTTIDLPVGDDLHDHLSGTLYWKLKHPERGLAIGHPLFSKPENKDGNPIDCIVIASILDTSKAAAIDKLAPEDPLIAQHRGHAEFFVSYAPIAATALFDHSLAGTHASTPILGSLPTSRGTVRLADKESSSDPVIDPNYLATEMDKEAAANWIPAGCAHNARNTPRSIDCRRRDPITWTAAPNK